MKITKRILSVVAAVLILTVSCLTAVVSADENTLTFNEIGRASCRERV